MKQRKNGSGRPISGSDDSFMNNEQFKKLCESVSLLYINTYVDLRRAFKQIAADRLRICATRCKQYTKFQGSDIDIICEYLLNCGYDECVVRFVRCTLDYYNDIEQCVYKSKYENVTIGPRKKEWKHAIKDIETTYRQHIKCLAQRLQETPPSYYTEDMLQRYNETALRYQAFGVAVQIVCDLFDLLYTKELPNELSLKEYEDIQGGGPVVERCYEKKEDVYMRKPSVKKPRVECLGLTMAVQISLTELGKNE